MESGDKGTREQQPEDSGQGTQETEVADRVRDTSQENRIRARKTRERE